MKRLALKGIGLELTDLEFHRRWKRFHGDRSLEELGGLQMRGNKIVLAFLRNRRTSLIIFLPILFLGIVLSSTPVISIANVGVIVNFLFQKAYPMDAYALINLTFNQNSFFESSMAVPFHNSSFKLKIQGVRFIGSIGKDQEKIWKNVSSNIYRFGEIDLGGIGVIFIKNGSYIAPLTIFFLGPKSGKLIFGREVNSPQLIFPVSPTSEGMAFVNLSAGFLCEEHSSKSLLEDLRGSYWNVAGAHFRVQNCYFPGCGERLKISYLKLEYLGSYLYEAHGIRLMAYYKGEKIPLGGASLSNWILVILPHGYFSKISSIRGNAAPLKIEGRGITLNGEAMSSHLGLFLFGVNPGDFINQLYTEREFHEKLYEELNVSEAEFLKAASGIPIVSWSGGPLYSISTYLGRTVLIHFLKLEVDTTTYLCNEYSSDVLTGNYLITASFIFTFPLLLLVSLVMLTTILENSGERAKWWIRTMMRRGIPAREIGNAILTYCIILGFVGAISGIIFSAVILPRIISVMLSLPITTAPAYYFGNYFLYVFSIPATIIISLFSVRKLCKGISKIPLVGVIPGISKETLRISKATLAISLLSLYGVAIWYFRISTSQVIGESASVMISALFIMSMVVSFPFLMLSPLIIPRFFSLLSFSFVERLSRHFERLAKVFAGELGKMGFNSSRRNVDRIKVMGYALTLALSTTFGMIMVKGALPRVLNAISVQYSYMLGELFYVFKAIEMLLSMISIFSFAIGIVGTYGCILEMIEEVRPQLIVARARGASPKDIIRISYGTLVPYLLYASVLSVAIGFTLMISVDALLALLGMGTISVPHLIPTFDPFLGMYFAYLALIFLAPYLVTRALVGRKLGEELRRVWS